MCLGAKDHDAREALVLATTESFESGLRVWELDVGEWECASGTALADAITHKVIMNMAPFFLGIICSLVRMHTVQLFEQLCCDGVFFIPAIWDHPRQHQ